MMELRRVKVAVPATSANLGPGFDCLALALNLWNKAVFEPQESGYSVEMEGEGAEVLPTDRSNLIMKSAFEIFNLVGSAPPGLSIHCQNSIPLGSGLGSSAAAVVLGLVGANKIMGAPFDRERLLKIASSMEGHPDNAAAALYGGLAVVLDMNQGIISRKYDLPEIGVALAVPKIDLPTHAARKALPATVDFKDAVFNSSRIPLVVEALRSGDLGLLGQVMEDRLHQPYRLPLIPGAQSAIDAALASGASAAALSGAGPSVIAFLKKGFPQKEAVRDAMVRAYQSAGVEARGFDLMATNLGAIVK
jgi:homoserine kinase